MTEAKFTKGPWHYEVISDTVEAGQHTTVCNMDIGCNQDENEENIANAHLIAAAPDLYEALYRLTRDCEIAGLQEQAGFDCWISMANTALAKARGETQ